MLDLSCNKIGDNGSKEFIKKLNDYFLDNVQDGLIHLDISFNGFNDE